MSERLIFTISENLKKTKYPKRHISKYVHPEDIFRNFHISLQVVLNGVKERVLYLWLVFCVLAKLPPLFGY